MKHKKGQWQTISKRMVYAHPFQPVEEWTMKIPNGSEHTYAVQVAKDVVVVFGITEEKKVLLLRQYYVAHNVKVPTLVAGIVDSASTAETANRELREEAGCQAREMIYLGEAYKGKYATGKFHFYLAMDVEVVGSQQLEPSEDIEVSFISVSNCIQLLRSGQLQDVSQQACAYRALDHLGFLCS